MSTANIQANSANGIVINKSQKKEQSFIDLNEVFQKSIKTFQRRSNVELIMRSDEIPEVYGNEESLTALADNIVYMILSHVPQNNKLFIYIECENEDLLNGKDFKNFEINFHTNIMADDLWQQQNSETLKHCTQIVSAHNGSFVYNKLSTPGCLFSIILPGKK